jgi:uncharacterized protein YjdB
LNILFFGGIIVYILWIFWGGEDFMKKERLWRRIICALLCAIVILATLNVGSVQEVKAADDEITVTYSGHMQTYGNLAAVSNGTTLGRIPTNKRLEAITINSSANLTYQVHVQGIGWQGWKVNGQMAGTVGKSKRIEAIMIKLTGEEAENYDVYYRVHLANSEWLSWSKNGAIAGTTGYGAKLDGIQIRIVSKSHTAPTDVSNGYLDSSKPAAVSYSGHAQSLGNLSAVSNGAVLGSVGKGKRLEAIKLSLTNTNISGGLSYRVHVQGIGWQAYRSENELAGTTGKSKRMEAVEISLTGDISKYYDVYYRVHVQSYGWLDWAKDGQTAGSTGMSKRIEAIQIKLVAKGGTAPGATSTPYIESVFQASKGNRVVKGIGDVDLWIGDSRFVGLGAAIYGYEATTESYHSNMVARVSANYSWLNKTGYSLIAERLNSKPDAVIVANFGLNDIGSQQNYLNFYKRLHSAYPRATICVMSVNPVGSSFRYSNNYGAAQSFNESIKTFNQFMKAHCAEFGGYYIDTFNNCDLPTSSDGIHYSSAQYWTMYHYVTGK